MKYKILVLKNSPAIDVADECAKATQFFASRSKPIFIEFTIKDISIPFGYKVYKTIDGFNSINGKPMLVDYLGLDDYVKDNIRNNFVKEKEYNAVMIVTDVTDGKIPPGIVYSNWTNWKPLYFTTGYMQIIFNKYLKSTNEVDNAFKHEPMHDFCFALERYGFPVRDEMDIDHLGRAYYRNDFPEDTDSNFGFTFKNLSPYIEKLYANAIMLGMRTLRWGDRGEDVGELQKALNLPVDGIFGQNTLKAVKAFQEANLLVSDGVVGPLTIAQLKLGGSAPKLELWIQAIKIMEGAKPERNNPGNLRFVGQTFAINDNGFCKFDTYQHGYEALKKLLVRAASGGSNYYKPTMSLYDFYNVYAPSSDGNNPKNYAEFVAKKVGVLPTEQIKNLI